MIQKSRNNPFRIAKFMRELEHERMTKFVKVRRMSIPVMPGVIAVRVTSGATEIRRGSSIRPSRRTDK